MSVLVSVLHPAVPSNNVAFVYTSLSRSPSGRVEGICSRTCPPPPYFSAPSQRDAVHFIFPSPPTLSLSLRECYYYCPNNSAALALRSTGLSAGAEPLRRGNLPRSEPSLFAGFTAPRVFSRGLPPPTLDDGEDKHVACRITEL